MRITVIGAGYVGLVAAVCFAHGGHQVICLEKDEARCQRLTRGECPILEKDLPEMFLKVISQQRISFTTCAKEAVSHGEVIFIAVGTPPRENGQVDLTAMLEAAAEIGHYVQDGTLIVIKSTVPPGTTTAVRHAILWEAPRELPDLQVICNPEFLREGTAVEDFLAPERIVVGADEPKAGQLLLQLYRPLLLHTPVEILTSPTNAELIKYASNSYLAVRLSFVNELAGLCEKLGGNIGEVTKAMGLDHRIGPDYLRAGLGYGGACLPKDTQALAWTAREAGVPLTVLECAITANRTVAARLADRVAAHIKPRQTIAIWGVSFKPGTEDTRDSPVLSLMKELSSRLNCKFQLYDPTGQKFAQSYPEYVRRSLCRTPEAAATGASALIIGTAWPQFKEIELSPISSLMTGRLIFDFAGVFDRTRVEKAGFAYYACGEP